MIEIRLKAMENAEILNVRDIMAVFSIDRATVYNWKKAGKLQLHKIGGRWYAHKEDVERLIQWE